MDEHPGKGRPVVLSLHGIRTRGKWQKDLTRALNEAGFVHEPLDFGFFHALSLLNPRMRRNRVDWFLEQYTTAISGLHSRPSIIAHSFGSYLVARTLRIYKQVKFDRVILCGSIVRRDYPWSKIFERKQVSQLLHDYGKLDVWARVVGWVTSDAGDSGLRGFTDVAKGRVIQQCHPEFRHSDYFYKLNYKENWIPFLNGTHAVEDVDLSRAPPNWPFRIVLALVVILAIGAGAYAWRHFDKSSPIEVGAPAVGVPVENAPSASKGSIAPSDKTAESYQTPSALRIKVKTDASCSLQVNGDSAGDLEPGVSRLLEVDSNSVNVVCTSLDYATIADSRELTVSGERVDEVLLRLRKRIEDHEGLERQQETELKRQEFERKEREKDIQQNFGFENMGSGAIREISTRLLWLAAPRLMNAELWKSAPAWCATQGSRWRLPTSDELKRIVHPGATGDSLTTISPLFTWSSPTSNALSSTSRKSRFGVVTYQIVDLKTAQVTEAGDSGIIPGGQGPRMNHAMVFCVSEG